MIRLLLRIRFLSARHGLRILLTRRRFRLVTVILTVSVFWSALFWGFYRAFVFLQGFLGLGEILIDRLIYLLSFALFGMLVISNAVISFQLHYKARETASLLSLPLPCSSLFLYLLSETVVLSTWATVFLVLPVALAYGLTHALPPWGYLGFPLFGFSLAALAALLGSLLAAGIPRILASPRLKVLAAAAILALALVPLGRRFVRPPPPRVSDQRMFLVNDLLKHSRLTLNPLLPSYWAAEGFLQFVRGRPARAWEFLAVLGVNLLFLSSAVHLAAGIPYYRTWALYRGRGGGQKRVSAMPQLRGEVLAFLSPPARAFLVKDAKTFLREPSQWIQALVLFGLLAIYIVNIKNMPTDVRQLFWKNLITFFNLGASSLILATLTTRFVFPALSLEGRTFWVLGLAPARRSLVFWSKFWTSFLAALLVTEGLIALSNHILEVPAGLRMIAGGTILLMCLALTSLALGMGAIFPDFKEDNPARIASGFGGTLSLVLSLIYIAITLGIVVATVQLAAFRKGWSAPFQAWLLPAGITAAVLFTAAVTGFSLRLGRRALDRRDF